MSWSGGRRQSAGPTLRTSIDVEGDPTCRPADGHFVVIVGICASEAGAGLPEGSAMADAFPQMEGERAGRGGRSRSAGPTLRTSIDLGADPACRPADGHFVVIVGICASEAGAGLPEGSAMADAFPQMEGGRAGRGCRGWSAGPTLKASIDLGADPTCRPADGHFVVIVGIRASEAGAGLPEGSAMADAFPQMEGE